MFWYTAPRSSIIPTWGLILILVLSSLGHAQNSSTSPPASTKSGDVSAQSGTIHKKENSRRGEFVVAPIPVSSPALGTGIIPVLAYIFRINTEDKASPPSVLGVAGLITDNGSRAFAFAGQLYLRQDTYRVSSAFLQGNLNYNLYGIGSASGNAGLKLPLKQEGSVFLGEVLRRLKWQFFAGPRIITGHSSITRRLGGTDEVPAPQGLGLKTKLTSIGLEVNRDTRDNRFYPKSGTVFEFTSDFFATSLGSEYSFQSFRTTFNKYWGLTKRQVLAYNAYFCATGGEPPFYGNCIYGTSNELRGYEAGRYIDRFMIATQLEYRLSLPKRLGVVGFAGTGGVASGGRRLFNSSSLLPAGGGGLRFLLSRSYHVNFRADIAAGKNEHTVSMGVSEAF